MSAAMRRPLVGLHLTVAFTSRESWLADFSLNHRAKETLLLHLAQLREGSGDGRSVVACLGPEFLEIFKEIWGQASPTEISKRFGRLAAFRRLAKFSRNFRRSNSEDQPAAGGIFLKEVLAFTFSLHFWVSATSPLSPFCVRSQIDGVKSKLSVNKSPRGTRTSKSSAPWTSTHQGVPDPAPAGDIHTAATRLPPVGRCAVGPFVVAITSHPVSCT